MDEDRLVAELKAVREKGVARASSEEIPLLHEAAAGMSLEEFLRLASEKLDQKDAEGVRIALGIGGHGQGRSSADRRADFATHYQRAAETVRRKDGIEDQVFRKLAREILRARQLSLPGPRSQGSAPPSGPASDRVRVGRAPEVGPGYQRRVFDDELERMWTDSGDRRVWLRGHPGLGKSYTARRVAQEADDSLVVWVESAAADAARAAYSQAAERMPHLGLTADASDPDRVRTQAENLLRELESSRWTWLVILDDADAAALLDAHLIPTGRNPNGRVLITTVDEDTRMTQHGRIVRASPFTNLEAEEYLRSRVDARDGQRAALSKATKDDRSRLAETLGHHPLALSTASATMTANHQAIPEWIAEFHQAPQMDEAADEPDAGGYPHAIGQTFRLALEKASAGFPRGLIQRAATVAAVQDPDGHPTWQWDRVDVRNWVAGDMDLDFRHSRPVVVDRLRVHGLVEVVGDSWGDGRIAMHQLVGRAIREQVPADDLMRIGEILTLEWLANLVIDDSLLGPNIAALLDNTGVDETPVRIVAAGLAMFTRVLERESDTDASPFWSRQLKMALAQYGASEGVLPNLGPRSKHMLATQAGYIALSFRKLGDVDSATRFADRAISLNEEIIADPGTSEVQRADALVELCEYYEAGGDEVRARANREAAAEQYERLLLAPATAAERIDWVIQLAALAEDLGDPDRADRAQRGFSSAPELLSYSPGGELDAETYGDRLEKLASLQRNLGQVQDSRQTLVRCGAIYREFGLLDAARDADIVRLALIAEAGDWNEAEEVVARLLGTPERAEDRRYADDLMRLASVHAHLRESERAVQAVAQAIEIYRASKDSVEGSGDPVTESDDDLSRRGIEQLQLFGVIEHEAGRLEDALQIYAQELEQRASVGFDPFEDDLADIYYRLGVTAFELRRYPLATEHLASAVRIYETLIGLAPEETVQGGLKRTLLPLALAQRRLGESESATLTLRRLIALLATMDNGDPADTDAQTELCQAMEFLAVHIAENEGVTESIELLQSSLQVRRAIADVVDTHATRVALADTLGLLAGQLASIGESGRAAVAWAEQLRLLETHGDQSELSDALLAQGLRFRETDDERAIALVERGVYVLESVVAADQDDLAHVKRLATARVLLAMLYDGKGSQERRGAQLWAALEPATRLCAADPGDLESQAFAAAIRAELADWLCAQNRWDESIPHFSAAISTFQLLLDLHVEVAGLPQQLLSTLRSLRDALRTSDRDREAYDVEARIQRLRRQHPDLEASDEG